MINFALDTQKGIELSDGKNITGISFPKAKELLRFLFLIFPDEIPNISKEYLDERFNRLENRIEKLLGA